MILDISNDLMQYNDLFSNTSNIFDGIKTIGLILLIVLLIFIPIFLYLKYIMQIKIVKKGTLQALNEFYGKQNNNTQTSTENNIENKKIEEVTNNTREEVL